MSLEDTLQTSFEDSLKSSFLGDSSFTPSTYSNQVFWYDASDSTTVDASPVNTWTDKFGNNNATKALSGVSEDISVTASGKNSLDVLGGSSNGCLDTGYLPTGTETLYAVVKLPTSVSTRAFIGTNDASGRRWYVQHSSDGTFLVGMGSSSASTTNAFYADQWVVIALVANGSTYDFYVNGVKEISAQAYTFPSASATSALLFCRGTGNPQSDTSHWNTGLVGEIVCFSDVHTDLQVKTTVDYLSNKWLNLQKVLIVGQSVGDFLFNDGALTDADAGKTALVNAAQTENVEVGLVNGCKAGIAVRDANAGAAGAYLDTNDALSATYTTEVTDVLTTASVDKEDINQVIIIIGNTDADAINAGTSTKAETKTSYQAFITLLKQEFPNAAISLVPLGVDYNSTAFTGYREFGQLESELMEDFTVNRFPSYVIGPYRDDTHLNDAGATAFGDNLGNAIAGIALSDKAGTLGPRPVSLTIDVPSNTVFINYELDGSAISQADGAALEEVCFVLDIDGTVRNTTDVTLDKTNNRIDTTPSGYILTGGEVVTLNCMNTTFRNQNLTAIPVDSNGLPMQKRTDITATA